MDSIHEDPRRTSGYFDFLPGPADPLNEDDEFGTIPPEVDLHTKNISWDAGNFQEI